MNIGGDSLMIEQPLFQVDNGGLIPTSPLQTRLYECFFEDITHIFRDFHYKGQHMGGGITTCFCLKNGMYIVAGAVLGKCRHDKKYSKEVKTLEIRRMACLDNAPKNIESYFLSKIIWFIKKNYKDIGRVISYSDLSVGHYGTIYKAANFKKIGETTPTNHVYWNGKRYHPRSLSIERPYSYKLREAVKSGEAAIMQELPKYIWEYKF